MSRLVKLYKVEFLKYTNCLKDTVRHNEKDMCFLDVGRDGFIITEDEFDDYRHYGGGFKSTEFVGNMMFD